MEGKPSEVLRTPGDGRKAGTELPRRNRGLSGPKAPALWSRRPAREVGGVWGQYPAGRGQSFLGWLHELLGRPRHERALHVCSGALGPDVWGIRLDVRPDLAPDVVACGTRLPFRDGAFDAVAIDPPYSVEYARSLYGTSYPRPSHLLREAARVTAPGGRISFLHFIVPNPPKGTALESVHGITQGCGYRIRALTVYRRDAPSMFDGH